jgi:hypothetical protein
MNPGYIDLENISHLNSQAKVGGVYDEKRWRESYYFNMTDPRTGITLITTIGILPNKKLNTGMFMLVKDGKVLAIKPLLERKRVRFTDYAFTIKGLEYRIEGTDWKLRFDSKKISFNILFRPINKIFPYFNDGPELFFSGLGSQHYEQFGVFEGELQVNGIGFTIGPTFGHRDHSWGKRDWSWVDHYRLFCCAFSDKFAFNLWEGRIQGRKFLKGYTFDGVENTELVESKVVNDYARGGRRPQGTMINIKDAKGRGFDIDCQTIFSIKIPPRQSIMYESTGEYRCCGESGYGVAEYLYHEPNALYRFGVFLSLLRFL